MKLTQFRQKKHKHLKNLNCLKAQSEDDLHKQIAKYLTFALHEQPGVDWETIEASNQQGGVAGLRKQVELKAKGVKAGTPDILVTYNKDLSINLHSILRLEIKTETGRLTESQKKRIPLLERTGQLVYIVRSVEDVEASLRNFGVPFRGVVV